MPEKRRLSLSFSLTQREQRNAWERLSAVAPGQRMDAVCRMINGYMEQQELLEAVRKAFPSQRPLRSRSRPGPSMRTSSAFSVRCRREMRSPDTIF